MWQIFSNKQKKENEMSVKKWYKFNKEKKYFTKGIFIRIRKQQIGISSDFGELIGDAKRVDLYYDGNGSFALQFGDTGQYAYTRKERKYYQVGCAAFIKKHLKPYIGMRFDIETQLISGKSAYVFSVQKGLPEGEVYE